jgi:hypothetical protein
MLTADGARRREAGGTFLTLFAACVAARVVVQRITLAERTRTRCCRRVAKADLKAVLAAAAKDLKQMQAPASGGAEAAHVAKKRPAAAAPSAAAARVAREEAAEP